MAATISSGPQLVPISSVPTTRLTCTQVLCDASYPTGGYALTPVQLGLTAIGAAICTAGLVQAAANVAIQWVYNVGTGKLQGFALTGEIANATVLTNQTVNVIAIGY